ncbi:MAG: RHS repeat domain-containing protein [Candidatus Dormibacteria bacterium]
MSFGQIELSKTTGCLNKFPVVSLYAMDGSGWALKHGDSNAGIYMKDGTQITYFNGNTQTITDTNGNQITIGNLNNSNCGASLAIIPSCTVTDTLGRTLVADGSYYDSSNALQHPQYGYEQVSSDLSAYCPGCTNDKFTGQLLHTITLPNGGIYTIDYVQNSFGQPSAITLPTGGRISFTWAGFDNSGPILSSKTITDVNGNSSTWTYQSTNWEPSLLNQTYISKITDPYGNDTVINVNTTDGIQVSDILNYQGSASGGTLLKTKHTDYYVPTSGQKILGNALPIRETTTWYNSPQPAVSKTETDYEILTVPLYEGTQNQTITWGNPQTEREYDFGPGDPGALLRTTTFTYLHDTGNLSSPYFLRNIADRPVLITATGPGGTTSQTQMIYDTGRLTPTGTCNPLTGAPQHDYCNFGTSNSTRGNPTLVEHWSSSLNGWLTTNNSYNDLGKIISTADPKGNLTSFGYTDNFTDGQNRNVLAFLTQITYPPTNEVNHIERKQYYFGSGLLAASCGENFPITNQCNYSFSPPVPDYKSYAYDEMNRVTAIKYGDGGGMNVSYTDTPPVSIKTITAIVNSMSKADTTVFDGLGRIVQTQLNSDPEGAVYVDSTYDLMGRKASVTNPYRSSSGSSNGTTSFLYDALGRLCLEVPPDGTSSPGVSCPSSAPKNDIFTAYSGNMTTVIDEAGRTRKSQTDGLGRLVTVWEDPSGMNLETVYQYDALNNLTSVVQAGSHSRTFTYDSLSHLMRSSYPEISGSISYTYDANGNLASKTAPAPNQTGSVTFTINYTYDALDRILTKAYTGGYPTPPVAYSYDLSSIDGSPALTNPVGRLIKASVGGSSPTASYNDYDLMGRIANHSQCAVYNCGVYGGTYPWWKLSYTYDLNGDLTSFTDGSGITFSQTFDQAARPTQLTSSYINALHPGTLASVGATNGYWPSGESHEEIFGNGVTDVRVLDSKLQICRIETNTSNVNLNGCADSTPSGNVLDFNYGYNLGIADNGNLASWSAIGAQTFSRNYTYDQVNRIVTMSGTGGLCTGMNWTYDAWGNRTNQTPTGGTCPSSQPSFNANNQIIGDGYDAAGNLIAQTGGTYQYDDENRLVSAVTGSGSGSYVYDADGQRVAKSVGSAVTYYLYDLAGRVVSEWSGAGGWNLSYAYFGGGLLAKIDANSTAFIHANHLGSTRLVTSYPAASPIECDGYEPYGELDTSVCTPPLGTGATTHKFTGKERDTESDLDNFGARYMTSSMGRFMSPDPINLTAKRLINPANTLNKYIYAGNNPLFYIDPTGQDITVFYRAPSGAQADAGHILLAVTNQATGAVRFADYYPKGANKGLLPAQGEMNQGVTSDRLKQMAALTIKTTPEIAQKLIDAIDALSKQTPTFAIPFSDCVTVCSDLLNLAGIDVPSTLATPTDVWSTLYDTYSSEALTGGQLHMGLFRYQPGRDFGSSMSVFPGGTNPFFNLQLLDLLADQRQQEKGPVTGCVSIFGPKGKETTCN